MAGSDLEEQRARLAGLLALRAGLEPHQVAARMSSARADDELVEDIVCALVDGGGYLHEEVGSRRVRLEELDSIPVGGELLAALDRRRSRPLLPLQRVRLGRLYALASEVEKAAVAYREVLAGPEAPPLSLAVELAAAAARAGLPAIALAGVDRIAEVVLTRDQGETPPGAGGDPLRDDPLGAGALLERARDVALEVGHAPRAVALARAATALYERLGRRAEARHSLAGQARALRAAGNAKKARLQLERWRELARDVEAASDEAAALEALAAHEAAEGQVQTAAGLLEEAAKLLRATGDLPRALRLVRQRARHLSEEGALERAVGVLEEAALEAAEAGLSGLAADLGLDLVEVQLQRGWLGPALQGAEALRRRAEEQADGPREQEAILLFARALTMAGDEKRALEALRRLPPSLELAPWVGHAMRLRAELLAQDGQALEAELLLLDAARTLRAEAPAAAAEALLRRAELCQEGGHAAAAVAARQAVADLGVPPALELRYELLAARQCQDEEEQQALLEELWEGSASATLEDRARAAVALARRRIAAGDPAGAVGPVKDVLEELREVQEGLPEPLRAGFGRSPVARGLLLVTRELEGADPGLEELVLAMIGARS